MIAGMSGKFPESENLEEFWANLIGGVDMVTEDDRRWKAGEWVACPPLLAVWGCLAPLGDGARVGSGPRPREAAGQPWCAALPVSAPSQVTGWGP